MSVATIAVKPMTPVVGAEVQGLDLSRPLDDDTIAALRRAFERHVALVFRDQDISEDDQLRFAAYFGPIGVRRRAPKDIGADGAAMRGNIMLVTNIPEEAGKEAGSYGDGEMWFHGDTCYYEAPNRGTFLYSQILPGRGGNTRVNSMYAAYDNVPRALKERLEGRRVLQVHDYKRRERIDIETADISKMLHCWQPVFVTHPATGRRALYVNRLMSARIEGLEASESEDILERLFAIGEDPSIIYEHVWRPGDLLMWDNYCSIHARTDFPREEPRLLRRCTIQGQQLGF